MKMIVAVDRGNAIGWSDGRLPWHIPDDLKRFKALTVGHTIVMGFNTFVSLNRRDGLPNRENVLLTRKNPIEAGKFAGDNVSIVSSLDYVQRMKDREVWIIGGASVYGEAIERQMIDELHVTFVHQNSGSNVVLPFELTAWKLFMLRERAKGVIWTCSEEIEGNGFTVMVFKRGPRPIVIPVLPEDIYPPT